MKFHFQTSLVPRQAIPLDHTWFDYSDASKWRSMFGLNFEYNNKTHVCCVKKKEYQEAWVESLHAAGAKFREVIILN